MMVRYWGVVVGVLGVVAALPAEAQVVEPQPQEYVRVCDVYGTGFFYIPGTETCVNASTGQTRTETQAGTVFGQTALALRQSEIEARIDKAFQQSAISNALEDPDLVAGEQFGLRVNWGAAGQSNAFGLTGMAVIADGVFGNAGRIAVSGGIAFSSQEVGGRAGMQLTW